MITEKELEKFTNLMRFYNIGNKLNSIKTFSTLIGINKYSVRKLIYGLIAISILEKYNNRFFVISKNFNNTPKAIQEKLINKAKININILKLMQQNFIYDRQTLSFISQDDTNFIIYFPISRKNIIINKIDIQNYKDADILLILKRNKLT